MAIEVEQEKKSVNWVMIISVIIIVAVIFAGAYFLFFKQPELIDVAVPDRFESFREIQEVELNAEELLQSPQFRMLRQFSTDTSPPNPGRANPFEPYAGAIQ